MKLKNIKIRHISARVPAKIKRADFSRAQLVIFLLAFGAIGSVIYFSHAAVSTRSWDSQADFQAGTLSNTTATADGHLILTPSGGSSFNPNGPFYLSAGEVNQIKSNISSGVPAVVQAWNNAKSFADGKLNYGTGSPPNPCGDYSSNWFNGVYNPGWNDGHAAHGLALAYLLTGNTQYASAARGILMHWVQVYTHPPGQGCGVAPGHMVAEPDGPMLKLFMTADMLRGFLSASDLSAVQTWAPKWISVGKSNADFAMNSPWVADVTLGGVTTNAATYGNSPIGQRAMAVWAAAIGGGTNLQTTLDWNYAHNTSLGKDYGWNNVMDKMFLPSHCNGTHTQCSANGEPLEAHWRQSIGYGLFTWKYLVMIADVAGHANWKYQNQTAINLFTFKSSRGNDLFTQGQFTSPFLQKAGTDSVGGISEFYLNKYDGHAGPETSYGTPSQTVSFGRAVTEAALRHIPAGHARLNDFQNAVNFGGNTQRGNNYDADTERWSALMGQITPTSSGATTYPTSGSDVLSFDAGASSNWSNLVPVDSKPSGTSVVYEVRTSLDNNNWSAWNTNPSSLPAGRYVQVRASLSTSNTTVTPTVDKISIDYTPAADTAAPSVPTNLSGSVSGSQVNLTWTPSTDNIGVASYKIYRNGSTTSLASVQNGPIFGKSALGALRNGSLADRKRVTRFNLSQPADITKLVEYLEPRTVAGTELIKGIIYDDDGPNGEPGTLLAVSNELQFTQANTAKWYDLTLTSPVHLNLGNYWLGDIRGGTQNLAWQAYDDVNGSFRLNTNTYSSGPSASFGTTQTANVEMSIYAAGNPNSFTDTTTAAGVTYTYQVTALDAAGNESAKSTQFSISVPGGTQPKTGDLNGDNKVDIFDLSILLSHYSANGTPAEGDINNDGIINIFDLSILLSKYGT